MRRLRYPLLALFLLPAGTSGQDEATGTVEASLGVSSVAGNAVALVGARLWLHLSPTWRIGASGQSAVQHPDGGDLAGSGLEADFGQAGAIAGFRPGWAPGGVELRLFAGIGSVALSDRVTGNTVDTEAFAVFEPSLAWDPFRRERFTLGFEAGYRWVAGADAITRLDSSALQSTYGAVFVSLSPF